MTRGTRRSYPYMKSATAVVCAAACLVLWATPSASGFQLSTHRQILVAAFPGFDPSIVSDIYGNFFLGTGNAGSDLFQFQSFRHFDNAALPGAVCALANQAWSQFTGEMRSALDVQHLEDVVAARHAFGALTHAVQDFYAHSNWLELGERAMAPLFPVCTGVGLPGGLQTGYFRLTLSSPLSGCPLDSAGRPNPPVPFLYCHLNLNKDAPTGHGADPLPGGGGQTYYAAAVALAIQATQAIHQEVRAWLTATITPATDDQSGACLADLIFSLPFPGVSSPVCLDLSGVWRKIGSNPPDVGGTTWTLTRTTALTITGTVQTQTCGPVALAVSRISTPTPVYVGTINSCPLDPPSTVCPATIQLPLTLRYNLALKGRLEAELTAIDIEETASECRLLGGTVQYISLAR